MRSTLAVLLVSAIASSASCSSPDPRSGVDVRSSTPSTGYVPASAEALRPAPAVRVPGPRPEPRPQTADDSALTAAVSDREVTR